MFLWLFMQASAIFSSINFSNHFLEAIAFILNDQDETFEVQNTEWGLSGLPLRDASDPAQAIILDDGFYYLSFRCGRKDFI